MRRGLWRVGILAVLFFFSSGWIQGAKADIKESQVLEAIERGKKFLSRQQHADGSWSSRHGERFQTGVTSLAVLALINSGMSIDDKEVRDGLKFLRRQDPGGTYEISLMIMALAAAKDGINDKPRISRLVRKLELSQIRNGGGSGLWGYGAGIDLPAGGGGDPSNGQYAVLGLREAQEAGVAVNLETWKRARDYWKRSQQPDGSWRYANQSGSGSMTAAGIASLVITEAMVRTGEAETNPDGSPRCCDPRAPDRAITAGVRWMGRHFSVRNNPGTGTWWLYYLYGLERAGRLSARRFFGEAPQRHDWYREGAEILVQAQQVQDGSWPGVGQGENEPVVGSSFALLFLSKGLAPVLINKLQYTGQGTDPAARGEWNNHPDDIRNLTQLISGLPKWPKLVTWQVVEMSQAQLSDLLQAPVLFLNGDQAVRFAPAEVSLLRDYIAQGGFIFAEKTCQGEAFEKSFHALVREMYPAGDVRLAPLTRDHAIYRSEYLIDASTTPLWGADVGCRTSIVYSPHDYSCLWDKWTSFAVPQRSVQTTEMVIKATNVGVNIVAYATGRTPANKLETPNVAVNEGLQDKIQRGQLQVAKLRHTGDWNAAPLALRNLLAALNRTVGMSATTKIRELPITDKNLFRYPLAFMHGRQNFQLSQPEREQLRLYIRQGGVLFADACCGSKLFDRGFREEMANVFPEQKLKRIPLSHELFKTEIGHDLRKVRRREMETDRPDSPLNVIVREVEPVLEGIEIDGKFVVIYSPFDISCALERQTAVSCAGYLQADAVKIAVNVVLYAMLQ